MFWKFGNYTSQQALHKHFAEQFYFYSKITFKFKTSSKLCLPKHVSKLSLKKTLTKIIFSSFDQGYPWLISEAWLFAGLNAHNHLTALDPLPISVLSAPLYHPFYQLLRMCCSPSSFQQLSFPQGPSPWVFGRPARGMGQTKQEKRLHDPRTD